MSISLGTAFVGTGARVLAQEGIGDPASSVQMAQAVATIEAIRVDGSQRVEPATVRSYLQVGIGDPFDPIALDSSLRALFNTGLFADVEFQRVGNTLVIVLEENPVINRIAFEGNRRIESPQLESEIQLRPRVVMTRTRVQDDVERIVELYRRSGRFAATVQPQIIRLDQNRVDLVFEIDEGPLTGVRRINFVGNERFSDSRLRSEIRSRETRWWRFLSTDDRYDPDRLAVDREMLRRFYLSQGYADFQVLDSVAELTPERDEFFVSFVVEEGERYRFGDINLTTSLPDLDVDTLWSAVRSRPGDWYSNGLVEDTIENLTDLLGDLQFAFVDIQPAITRDREERLINIDYRINEGPRVFVERIEINGNVRTADRVIRREMLLVEGDAFNQSRLARSEQRLRNLGFFSNVRINTARGSAADQMIVQVDVEEQSTGELSLGIGYSTTDGPLGDITVRERNLLGRGQDLNLRLGISGRRQSIDLSFTEPYFLERDVSAGFDVFHVETDQRDYSSYRERNTGFALRVGYPLAERIRQTVSYGLSFREIRGIDAANTSIFIRNQEGSAIKSSISHEVVFDYLDNRLFPTEGNIIRIGNELAGIGGDVQYLRSSISFNTYFPIGRDGLVFNVGTSTGYIVGLNQDVRINDRFFAGGDNLRGFRYGGIGPRDRFGDSLGGNLVSTGTVQLSFPLNILPPEFEVRGRTFSDFGILTEVDDRARPGEPIYQENIIRASVGVGLTWSSPLGPLNLDLAFPVQKADFDRTENFRISFGARF